MTATYDFHEVQPAPDNRSSRFLLPHSPTGVTQDPTKTLALIFERLAAERAEAREPIVNEQQTVKLKKVVRANDGSYDLVERTIVETPLRYRNARPGTLGWKTELKGSPLVENFLLGGIAYVKAPDHVVWEALVELCANARLSGYELRSVNDTVARALANRAGIDVDTRTVPF